MCLSSKHINVYREISPRDACKGFEILLKLMQVKPSYGQNIFPGDLFFMSLVEEEFIIVRCFNENTSEFGSITGKPHDQGYKYSPR